MFQTVQLPDHLISKPSRPVPNPTERRAFDLADSPCYCPYHGSEMHSKSGPSEVIIFISSN